MVGGTSGVFGRDEVEGTFGVGTEAEDQPSGRGAHREEREQGQDVFDHGLARAAAVRPPEVPLHGVSLAKGPSARKNNRRSGGYQH